MILVDPGGVAVDDVGPVVGPGGVAVDDVGPVVDPGGVAVDDAGPVVAPADVVVDPTGAAVWSWPQLMQAISIAVTGIMRLSRCMRRLSAHCHHEAVRPGMKSRLGRDEGSMGVVEHQLVLARIVPNSRPESRSARLRDVQSFPLRLSPPDTLEYRHDPWIPATEP